MGVSVVEHWLPLELQWVWRGPGEDTEQARGQIPAEPWHSWWGQCAQ